MRRREERSGEEKRGEGRGEKERGGLPSRHTFPTPLLSGVKVQTGRSFQNEDIKRQKNVDSLLGTSTSAPTKRILK